MGKLVVLKLDGDFDRGFRVTLEIGSEGDRPETEMTGNLPPATEVAICYNIWQSTYRSLGKATRQIKTKRAKIDGSLKKQKQECYTQAVELSDRLNTWLKAESFLSLREKWLEKVSPSEEVRVLIRTRDRQIWQLPWQQWDLLQRYNLAEIGVSTLDYEPPPKMPVRHNKVRILAILGNSEGIQVDRDKQQLENLPGAVTTFLVEPQRQELNDRFWEQPWDILFFAGHSKTEGEKGRIYLNQTDSLTLDELKYALKKAVASGLQLAIFNSCDGLGLASELEHLHIPQTIVMREPVPDAIAQAFLQYFLQAFASGKPLYLAVQEARQRLQGLEDEFPCASWLPVIFQNPAVMPLKWLDLHAPTTSDRPNVSPWRSLRTVLATSLVVTSLVMGVRWLGVLQPWELEAYDQLLRQRPAEPADSRLLLVGADQENIREYKYPLTDAILAQLIKKLEQHRPAAIGLDIFRNQPVLPGHKSLVAQLQQNQHFVTVCAFGTNREDAVAGAAESPTEQLSFNDLENDQQDYTVRRYLLSRNANPISAFSLCETPYSFSLQLAYRYLAAKGIPIKTTPDKNWQFGSVVFKRLESHSGGYQNLDARGNQVLLNYRATSQVAQYVTLKEVLTGQFNPNWVRNRVILIGVTATSIQDYHDTPYSRMRGLEVHGHMVSQILSAVLDSRPPIWWLPQWGDALWVWVWSLTGGILIYQLHWRRDKVRSPIQLVLVLSISFAGLYGLCWCFLLQGGWLPLVPAELALLITGGAIAYIPFPTQKT
ncbi:transmembrane sensor domain-containing protein [Cyanosarcina cf. burmensis CCALA 770]|nr:transmembrane sensor domain-containing protein [Cyanosarcina cf. burmensis CCALA 770]